MRDYVVRLIRTDQPDADKPGALTLKVTAGDSRHAEAKAAGQVQREHPDKTFRIDSAIPLERKR